MIAHGRKQISEMVYARKASEGGGAVRLTNMIRGGAVVFGGLVPSFKRLTKATMQAIRAAFGQTDGWLVIKATNRYLTVLAATDPTKAQALAAFINEDPMMVCSLGLSVEGVTMPIRWLVGDGTAWIETGHIFRQNQGRRIVKFKCTATGKAYRYWGSYRSGEGRSLMCYPTSNKITLGMGDGVNPDYNTTVDATVGHFYELDMSADNGAASFEVKKDGEVVKTGTYNYGRSIVVQSTEPIYADKENGVLRYNSPMWIALFKTIEQNEVTMEYVPCKQNGAFGFLDLATMTFKGNAAASGTFTIEYTLPDGTPWTPLNQQ